MQWSLQGSPLSTMSSRSLINDGPDTARLQTAPRCSSNSLHAELISQSGFGLFVIQRRMGRLIALARNLEIQGLCSSKSFAMYLVSVKKTGNSFRKNKIDRSWSWKMLEMRNYIWNVIESLRIRRVRQELIYSTNSNIHVYFFFFLVINFTASFERWQAAFLIFH